MHMATGFGWRWISMVVAVVLLAFAGAASAQTLMVTSAFDGTGAPFVRTEMVTLTLSGAEALRPVTLFTGAPIISVPVPGITGGLVIHPATIAPFGPFDGLGIFGGGFPLMTDANGACNLTLRIPANFGATLPAVLRVQALVLRNPFLSPNGEAFALSTAADVMVDEPATSPVITTFDAHLLQEGAGTTLVIFGAGFLPQATVLPDVTFTSVTSGANAAATSVTLFDADPGTSFVPALSVNAPAYLGAAAAPPNSSAGSVLVTVSYANSGLYPVNPAASTTTTLQVPFPQSTSLIWQTQLQPAVNSAFPKASLSAVSCNITVDGSNFLNGAEVLVNGVTASSTTVLSGTQLQFTPPLLSAGVHDVVVRNPDHVATSPRQSAVAPPATDFVVFNPVVSSIAVTAIVPSSAQEGAATPVIISGTCATQGGYTALDPQLGTTTLSIGSNIAGSDASSAAIVNTISIGAPGSFTISATLPALPPGLNPAGVTAGGLSNAGLKHVQVFAPPCLNPSNAAHQAFTAIPAAEPGNAFTYTAAAPPVVSSIAPNNCGRVEGGQSVTLTGTGFFTNLTGFPASNTALIPALALVGPTGPLPLTGVTMLDATTLTGTLPDATAFGGPLPLQIDLRVTNPDAQASSGAGDDFWLYPSLSSATPNTFALVTSTVNTGTLVTPVVYTFTNDVVLPAAALITAAGTPPLLIRCKGNVTIDGALNLDADAFAVQLSAAGALGGAAATIATLGVQDQFQGQLGTSPFDPLTSFFYSGGGLGGFHAAPDAGGGGGGGMGTAGAAGLNGSFLGGPGGLSYGFAALPIPLLGSATLMENFWPPGGSGGGAGGLGTPAPFDPLNPPPAANIGFNGGGGRGAGAVAIMADGVITVNGNILARGEPGAAGSAAVGGSGGGGGGGSGGSILLQCIRGVLVNGTALIAAGGGVGGLGGTPFANDGGSGSSGMIRFALPANSANFANVIVVAPGAIVLPAAGTTGY